MEKACTNVVELYNEPHVSILFLYFQPIHQPPPDQYWIIWKQIQEAYKYLVCIS